MTPPAGPGHPRKDRDTPGRTGTPGIEPGHPGKGGNIRHLTPVIRRPQGRLRKAEKPAQALFDEGKPFDGCQKRDQIPADLHMLYARALATANRHRGPSHTNRHR